MPKARVRILGSVGRAIQTGGTIIKELGSGEITLAQLKEALGLSGLGAPGQTGQPARPVVTTTAEPPTRSGSIQTPAVHLPALRRPAAMRGTIDSLLEGNDFWRTPSTHFDNITNRNWNLAKTIDDATSQRYAVSYVDGNRRALVDLASAHLNKNLSNIADDATSQRYAVLAVDGNRRALIDFSQSGHSNKTLSNIADDSTYARPRASILRNGVLTRSATGKNLLANPGFELNEVGTAINAYLTVGASVGNSWFVDAADGWTGGQFSVQLANWNSHSGLYAARILFNNGGSTLAANTTYECRIFTDPIPVLPGEVVWVGGYRRQDANVAPPAGVTVLTRLGAQFLDGNLNLISEPGPSDLSSYGAGWEYADNGGGAIAPANAVYVRAQVCAFVINGNSSAVSIPSGTIGDSSFDDLFLKIQVSMDSEASDGTNFLRMPSPPSVSAQANTLLAQSGATTAINVSAGTFYLGNITLNFNSGSVDPGSYGKWYVYFDDPGYAGGAVTFQASSSPLTTSQAPGRFYVGTITTASGGGGGGGSGGGGGCCLHESQMIELADGREIPARELTTDMVLLSHEGPVAITELRFLPHREWYKVRLDNGVELFVAGDHRFLDDDFNQLRTWDLKLGQRVRARNGYAIVTGMDVLWTEAAKVAIEVGEPHTYYVQGILSHNKALC